MCSTLSPQMRGPTRANEKVHEVTSLDPIANLGECSAIGDFFDAVHERAKIPCSNLRVSHELYEVVNDYYRAPLHLHAPVVQCPYK